ncbi:MAG TPA: trigger factor [Patescibacteria group bacterium]|nr:trigger factor [Patescibacteria group bacterium]
MSVTTEKIAPTKFKLTIKANSGDLVKFKDTSVNKLGKNVKVPGFRVGKAPAYLTEKYISENELQNEFLNLAISNLYDQTLLDKQIRAVGQPEISVTKFVPFTTLEFIAQTDAIEIVKVGGYKNLGLKVQTTHVTDKELNQALDNLLLRASTKNKVTRPIKIGDEVSLELTAHKPKSKIEYSTLSNKNIKLIIGQDSYIKGLDVKLKGLKTSHSKTFQLTLAKDFADETLKNKLVEFKVKINEVNELTKPKLDDKFAKTVGPFNSIEELKKDIKAQLTFENQKRAMEQFDNLLLEKISNSSEILIPSVLIDLEIDRLEEDEKRNIVYRGQTWQEHLKEENLSEEKHKEKQKPIAENRVKIGVILGVIANDEKIEVTTGELNKRITELKANYKDEVMQEELKKPENIRELRNRLMIEKTIDKIRSLNQ